MELDEEVREFLVECNEGLVNLDQEIVLLESSPADKARVDSVFRTFHTIKGTCGFFGFGALGAVAHGAESLLDQVRAGRRAFTSPLAALLLEAIDAIKSIVAQIGVDGTEGTESFTALRERLMRALESEDTVAAIAGAVVEESIPANKPEVVQPGDTSIRVDVNLLDTLMNLVGELVLARNQLLQSTGSGQGGGPDNGVIRTVQRLNVITSELQEGVLKTRMQPIGVLWNKVPRMVRDLAAECGKRIRLEMEGTETELDKTIMEAIKDPLTHIVRNACDHGVEAPAEREAKGKRAEGTVRMRAYHEGGHVNIEISDDGRGLDAEKLKTRAMTKGILRAEETAAMSEREAVQLVFAPGFSTADTITKISGRGVGMDVVKTNIQKIGGVVDIANRTDGPGSVVKIRIPLTLAIIPGLVVHAGEHRFMIPQANLLELVRLEKDEDRLGIEYVNGIPVYRRRGQLLPLTYLNRALGMSDATLPESAVINMVVLQAEERPFGLVVDGIHDTQEIVVKPLSKRLKGLSAYLGATIMGDGYVALILDVPGLARLAGVVSQSREVRKPRAGARAEQVKESFLLFRAGALERVAVPLERVARLEQISAQQVEYAAQQPAVRYRGEILPLLFLSETRAAEMQVIVLSDSGGERRMGVVVDEILDVVEEAVGYRQPAKHALLSGSALLGGAITDLLDVLQVFADKVVAR